MKKRILCLAMMMLLVIGTPLTASAAAPAEEADWSVNFDGGKVNSNLSGEELQNKLENTQPGDSITIKVDLENKSVRKSDWYMSNEIVKAMEDNIGVTGGAYTYILKYTDPSGTETELYNSNTVGGETASGEKKGLREIEGLEEHFYLGRLNSKEKAFITLYVELDGESIINSYQSNMAILDLNFAVEKITEGTVTNHVTVYTTKALTAVQTGDSAQILLYSSLVFASGLVLAVIAVRMLAKRRNEKGELQ